MTGHLDVLRTAWNRARHNSKSGSVTMKTVVCLMAGSDLHSCARMATMTENETFPEENPLSETATDCPIKAALGQVDGGGERHYLTSISPPEQIAQLAEVSPRAAEDSKIYAESIVNT